MSSPFFSSYPSFNSSLFFSSSSSSTAYSSSSSPCSSTVYSSSCSPSSSTAYSSSSSPSPSSTSSSSSPLSSGSSLCVSSFFFVPTSKAHSANVSCMHYIFPAFECLPSFLSRIVNATFVCLSHLNFYNSFKGPVIIYVGRGVVGFLFCFALVQCLFLLYAMMS